MPFTFAHPALVLPFQLLKKRWVSLTGLVAGSMAPDFEYFITVGGASRYGHSLLGMFWFDLPVAVILAFVFHFLVRDPLIHHQPRPLQKRLMRYRKFDWQTCFRHRWVYVLLCILIGAATHLFWDSFTHQEGFFVNRIPFLQQLVPYKGRMLTMHNILHIIFSVAGVLAVLIALFRLPPDRRRRTNKRIAAYWLMLLVMAGALFLVGVLQLTTDRMREFYYLYTSTYVIIAMSAGLISLLLTSVLFRKTQGMMRAAG